MNGKITGSWGLPHLLRYWPKSPFGAIVLDLFANKALAKSPMLTKQLSVKLQGSPYLYDHEDLLLS